MMTGKMLWKADSTGSEIKQNQRHLEQLNLISTNKLYNWKPRNAYTTAGQLNLVNAFPHELQLII